MSIANAFRTVSRAVKQTAGVLAEGNASQRRESLAALQQVVKAQAKKVQQEGSIKLKKIRRDGIHIDITFGAKKKGRK